jgi:predicted CopG family antitoxin
MEMKKPAMAHVRVTDASFKYLVVLKNGKDTLANIIKKYITTIARIGSELRGGYPPFV